MMTSPCVAPRPRGSTQFAYGLLVDEALYTAPTRIDLITRPARQ